MRQDLTDITLVVDRSGSMEACRSDAEGGVNRFIKEQQEQPGDALLTLVQFDTEYDFVHTGVAIKDVPEYRLVPRGMTALLDAVGRAVNETGERLDKVAEADRPGCVVFVIVTDGHENSSKEFTKEKVKEMIDRQRGQYNWQFTFLGADAAAFDEAAAMGIPLAAIVTYDPQKKSSEAYSISSSSVSRMRSASSAGQPVSCCYTDEERKSVQ